MFHQTITIFWKIKLLIHKCALLLYLLRLLFTDVCPSQHCGLDGGEDLQLSADGRDALTHLQKGGKANLDEYIEQKIKSSPGSFSFLDYFDMTCRRLVLILLSVHCLATSLASLVTSSEALAMSLAHWINARLLPLPPRTSRDISAISRAIRLAAAMMSLPWWTIEKRW